MTNPTNHTITTSTDPVTVSATEPTFLYFVSWTAMGDFGNCYVPLTFQITTRDDVEWVRELLREQGITNAVILSFALLPGGLG